VPQGTGATLNAEIGFDDRRIIAAVIQANHFDSESVPDVPIDGILLPCPRRYKSYLMRKTANVATEQSSRPD
jgi:hypothetical protein